MPPSALPDGDPAPVDGALPAAALGGLAAGGGLAAYVHVPFCRVRCGYCDFNTYAPGDLTGPGASTATYAAALTAEIDLAARVLADAGSPRLDTVFVGGGTPTLLPARDLVGILAGLRARWPVAQGAEVTTEANPDSVTPASLATLAEGGFTRISLGMQSAVPHVLATLDRTHDPANVGRAVMGARRAGLDVSLDLIYGTPGESLADWRRSVEEAIALAPQHISAYALVVEDGTRMAAQVRRGRLAAPDDDDAAEKYELAEALLTEAGYGWYEVSNWARPGHGCRHNLAYWRGGDWWGFGPGAHSHVGGVRWWNVRHPGAYAARLTSGGSPAAAREVLTAQQRADESILLGVRLREGLSIEALSVEGRAALPGLVADGLVEPIPAGGTERPRRVVLTLRGRLLADGVVRRLLGLSG
ncbi:MAG: radical SAM family heme chaperone HemW [Dermatophilaceae bacterium]